MVVHVRTHDGALVTPLEGGQAFETEPGIFQVLGELASVAPWSVQGIRVIVVGKDELANSVAMEELMVGTLAGGERRPFRLTLRALGHMPITNVYLHVAYDDVTPVDGTMPTGMLPF
jgi:hypothetical protein